MIVSLDNGRTWNISMSRSGDQNKTVAQFQDPAIAVDAMARLLHHRE